MSLIFLFLGMLEGRTTGVIDDYLYALNDQVYHADYRAGLNILKIIDPSTASFERKVSLIYTQLVIEITSSGRGRIIHIFRQEILSEWNRTGIVCLEAFHAPFCAPCNLIFCVPYHVSFRVPYHSCTSE